MSAPLTRTSRGTVELRHTPTPLVRTSRGTVELRETYHPHHA